MYRHTIGSAGLTIDRATCVDNLRRILDDAATHDEHEEMLSRYSELQDGFRRGEGYTIELKVTTVLRGLVMTVVLTIVTMTLGALLGLLLLLFFLWCFLNWGSFNRSLLRCCSGTTSEAKASHHWTQLCHHFLLLEPVGVGRWPVTSLYNKVNWVS